MGFKPYSLWLPPLEVTSGGIRVLYGLLGWLLTKGAIAVPNMSKNEGDFITIYPEIVNGNPYNADRVVRYILQTPGIMGSAGVPGPNTNEYRNNPIYERDKIYVFSKIYNTLNVDERHLMFLPIINTHVFKNYGNVRTKTCYLVGKGTNGHQHPEDAIEITREFANDQSALADLLNECHTMYGYDHMSAMYDIARMCGCKIKYLGSGTREELEGYEPGLDGIDFGDGSDLDPLEFREHYQGMVKTFSKRLDLFIQDTQQ